MMKIISKYIAKNVLYSILAVVLVVICLYDLFAFIDEAEDFSGTYGTKEAILYVILTTPRRIYEMLPISTMIGSLIGLGSLAGTSEITIMRSAGISIWRIIFATLIPVFFLLILSAVMSEFLIPILETKAIYHKLETRNATNEIQISARSVWHRQGNEFINVDTVSSDGQLFYINSFLFESDSGRMQRSLFAKSANLTETGWNLENVEETIFHSDNNMVSVNKHATIPWGINVNTGILSSTFDKPSQLSIRQLITHINYLKAQSLNYSRQLRALFIKIFQPFVTASLVLLASSFVFGLLRSVTLWQRVFTGVIVGFVFNIIQDSLAPMSLIYGFSPLISVLTPAAICAVFGIYMLQRAS